MFCPHPRVVKVAQGCIDYLNEETGKLPDEKTVWNISSDVIESFFGYFKSRKSPNSLNGITKQVLILPLRTKIDVTTGLSNINFKSALENVFLKDLDAWKAENLTDHQAVMRRKKMAA
ncbi:hypothetical protein AGMMS49525_09950 [Bacteroidia bacterium]|nr:hypothetical protein AGMMS49525_09950 [Bacteroidia bacterium]